jgi:hypothetical protein
MSAYRLGTSPIWIFQRTVGTALCGQLLGVAAPSKAVARLVHVPLNGGEGALCGAIVTGGQVGAVPVLLAEDDGAWSEDAATSRITVARYVSDRFAPPCRVTAQFAIGYTVGGVYRGDIECTLMTRTAHALAASLGNASATPPLPPLAAANSKLISEYEGLETIASSGLEETAKSITGLQLPVFGAATGLFYDSFDGDSMQTYPLMVGDEVDLVLLAHGGRGWRLSPDFLAGVYRRVGDGLQPVAGIYLGAVRSRMITVNVE